MNKLSIREELIERYNATGKIGLTKPKSRQEAMSLIETLTLLYEDEPEEQIFTLKEVSNRLKEFFRDF